MPSNRDSIEYLCAGSDPHVILDADSAACRAGPVQRHGIGTPIMTLWNDDHVRRDSHAVPDHDTSAAINDGEGIDAAIVTNLDFTTLRGEHGERVNLTVAANRDRTAAVDAHNATPRYPRSPVDSNRSACEAQLYRRRSQQL
ncbi:MAG: hypothetical protein WA747_02510 [Steroidobacteraceae bacterium]